ncbi:1,4-dihydroxy-6-naphthoate synthase [Lottiidibacillus patelloidae]|uniref:1,4-dihydroxy-6-naphtoate synthase n=1 Tax=Lottiidibacillus patelloidae TaxID=2670334 RepID=A0A263BW18_9BACI|nr:1,4-dihydroxy-6-naphthoate synthase [Lottiidibacillus patelloidae]OZM57376.1 1,4-dihydroxy-6-naphthoate synthase [Lottiidibacillus patelloidae]
MKIMYSPCPNDTFIFHALAHGLIAGAPKLDVTFADIDITNKLAIDGNAPDIVKISFAALPYVLDDYALIPCGGALGRGCGPLVLTNSEHKDPSMLAGKKVAVPSELSTAYLLFRLWAANHVPGGVGEIIVMPFHEIMPAVRDGKVDAGLVIHEARFTYQNYNLNLLTDLGSWWEEDTNLPIPLGAIIAKRNLDLESITNWIKQSVQYAWKHPDASKDYVMCHAQELSPDVAQAHIDLYVNDFSEELGDAGFAAITTLLNRAAKEGLVPKIDMDKLYK